VQKRYLPSARPVSWLLHPLVLLTVEVGGLDADRAKDFSAMDTVSSCFTGRVATEACDTFCRSNSNAFSAFLASANLSAN